LELHTANKEDGPALAVLDDDARMLGYYSVHDLQVLKVRQASSIRVWARTDVNWSKVIDTNPSISFTGQLHDTTGVDKFELTSEEYAQRQGTCKTPTSRAEV
jgi:tubulin-folding cofactor B